MVLLGSTFPNNLWYGPISLMLQSLLLWVVPKPLYFPNHNSDLFNFHIGNTIVGNSFNLLLDVKYVSITVQNEVHPSSFPPKFRRSRNHHPILPNKRIICPNMPTTDENYAHRRLRRLSHHSKNPLFSPICLSRKVQQFLLFGYSICIMSVLLKFMVSMIGGYPWSANPYTLV